MAGRGSGRGGAPEGVVPLTGFELPTLKRIPADGDDPGSGDTPTGLKTASGLARLLTLPKIGNARALRLAEHFGEWERLAAADPGEIREVLGAGYKDDPEGVVVAAQGSRRPVDLPPDVRVLGCFDADWPTWLRGISAPPVVIFVKGSLPVPGSVAVVGTRSPTRFGIAVVEKVVDSAAAHGRGIVSGLALGIDAAAHERALRSGALTWAILGGGVDVPTPTENRDLAERILEAGGGLISEQLPGSKPNPQRLLNRNRLQSAASEVVVVAQCGIPSGTLHTARYAIEQGRRLAVPRPRPPWDEEPQSAGNLALTDPVGCDPARLGVRGTLADTLRERRPIADDVLSDAADIERLWE